MTHGQMDDSSLPPSCCVLEQISNIQTTEPMTRYVSWLAP